VVVSRAVVVVEVADVGVAFGRFDNELDDTGSGRTRM
jgi:hypothetical protein